MKPKTETRGRKPLPPEKRKAPQVTVKINNFILPFVKELKGNLKKGYVTEATLEKLFSILKSSPENKQTSAFKDLGSLSTAQSLQNKIHQLEDEKRIIENKLTAQKERSLVLVTERDKKHLISVQTEGRLNSLKSSYRMLKSDYDALLHREYDCMAIKGNGDRCTKKAVVDAIQNGINIHVCVQHSKVLAKK